MMIIIMAIKKKKKKKEISFCENGRLGALLHMKMRVECIINMLKIMGVRVNFHFSSNISMADVV